ncbi:MAG: bacillithiol system redox-active protein YtxJ [Gemmatimonadaceae bacterium]|nr:bacillithiol system redox-active protein YtxJ [Gemmatimonadaceae bacterium]
MAGLQPVSGYDADIAPLLTGAADGVIFKHSPTCDLSAIAFQQMSQFTSAHPEVTVVLVDVLDQRMLSQRIERELHVRHESPQAIVLRAGQIVWHGSHRRVTAAAVEVACGDAGTPPATA